MIDSLWFYRYWRGGIWVKYRIRSVIGTFYKWVRYESSQQANSADISHDTMQIAVEDHNDRKNKAE